jgi:hypothetical protein
VKAERLIRNLARRLEQVAPGVSATILEGMDELLTVVRLKLPLQLRRSLACTNIIENMMGSVRRVCRNVKRWRDAPMALRWTGAAMQEAAKGLPMHLGVAKGYQSQCKIPSLEALCVPAHRDKSFSNGTPAHYQIIGTVTETGGKAVLDTALGAHLTQSPPFFPSASANIPTLLTGPPTVPGTMTPNPLSLTRTSAFATSGLFNLSVPATLGGFYQVNLSDRVQSNFGMGDVMSMTVVNCAPFVGTCGSLSGPYIRLIDANAAAGTITIIASVALDTTNQQILLELSKPDPVSDTVDGDYEYFNNGSGSGLIQLGSYSGLFTGVGSLNYTQAGLVQLVPVPEPSTLTLLVASIPGVLGLVCSGAGRRLTGGEHVAYSAGCGPRHRAGQRLPP